MPRQVIAWLAVVVAAASIAHSCGYLFGVSNQLTYFIEPLHRAHPELFRHDWLVTSTTPYHSVFAAAASYLFRWDDSGVIGCAIAHAIVMTAVVTSVFIIVVGATPRHALAVFVIVAAWLTINGDRSMAGSYLWSGYLQPSLIATLGWVLALGAYIRGRPLATGLALAVAGVFHVNFLLLGIGVFTLAELVAERRARRLAWLLAPQMIALIVLAPQLFASAGGHDSQLALWILTKFHAPVHYNPWAVRHGLTILVRWVALAIVVAPVAIEYGRGDAIRRLVTWCTIAGAICTLAIPLLWIRPLLPLTRLYVWRIAPFAQLAAMIVIALAAVATIDDPSRWRSQRAWRCWLAAALTAWIVWKAPADVASKGGSAIPIVAVGVVIAMLAAPRWRRALPIVVALVCLAVALGGRWSTIAHPRAEVASAGPETDALYAWARTSTPVDARFMTPPDLGGFRLLARRAIIADFKSPPLLPDEIVEWYRRLCRVVGDPDLRDVPQTNLRWGESTGSQLLARAIALDAQYLVLDRTREQADLPRAPVYANAGYVVYATTP